MSGCLMVIYGLSSHMENPTPDDVGLNVEMLGYR